MDDFERSDAINSETMWLPWNSRFFPALYRLFAVHEEKIEERLSEVMLSSQDRIEDE